MSKRILFLFLIIWNVIVGVGQDLSNAGQIFKEAFYTVNGTFVLCDLENDTYYFYNQERAEIRYPPIALETGVLENANSIIEWDSAKVPCNADWNFYPTTEWCRDQTLASAFKFSVVWFYQEVARQIGHERMQVNLDKINYGNNDIDGGIDNFWFWKLKISAKEQVDFLKKFYLEDIDFDPDNISIVKDIMILEETDDYVLYGKTGGGEIGEDLLIGWFVGFVERDDNVYIFALNIEAQNYKILWKQRGKIARNILENLHIF